MDEKILQLLQNIQAQLIELTVLLAQNRMDTTTTLPSEFEWGQPAEMFLKDTDVEIGLTGEPPASDLDDPVDLE